MEGLIQNKNMKEKYVPSANQAEIFVTLNGNRHSMAMARSFEAKLSIKTEPVPMLGRMIDGRKAQKAEGKFKMTIYKCTPIFDEICETFKNTGVLPYFDIQVTNEDFTTTIGRDTKIYKDCLIDGEVLLNMVSDEGDFIEQEIEGYYSDYEAVEKYTKPF